VPIYEYRCENGHEFEAFQNMTDDPVSECEVCGAPVQRVFSPVAVHYKGSGFYTTDYARKGKSGDGAKADTKSDSTSDSKKSDSKSSDSKPKSSTAKD
jgi:putative FmdB family regulatory protein